MAFAQYFNCSPLPASESSSPKSGLSERSSFPSPAFSQLRPNYAAKTNAQKTTYERKSLVDYSDAPVSNYDKTDVYSFSDEYEVSRVKNSYERKALVDYSDVPASTNDNKQLCFIFNQLSVYNQMPPYPPCPYKLDPFSRGTPSPIQIPEAGGSPKNQNDKETMLFQSPLKQPYKKKKVGKAQLSKSFR